MNKIKFSLVFFFLSFTTIFSQDFDLSILSIPDSLKTNANAVIRLENTNIEIKSSSKMIIKKEKIITVFNKHGDEDGFIVLNYDKYNDIKYVNVRVYDALGMEIKKVKKKEFKDVSAADGFSLYNDNRVYYYKHVPLNYPFTIKYEYEIESNNTAFIPRWFPISGYNVSTQTSKYNLIYPNDITINYKEHNLENYSNENNSTTSRFSYIIKYAKAIKYEGYSPSFLNFGPYVQFAANKFHLAGVDGEASNWKEFGKWMNDKLLTGRNDVSEATKLEIKNLVKNTEDPVERARLVYNYMQNKTRYINISIGIGGWKPMLASEVDKLGYGDCKALTNYTKSLLDIADVSSFYSVIYANQRRNIDSDLASVQGNHVFLMVPAKKDTIWLECTSQKVPFGYLGTYTDDRDVLVVTPEGGKIVHTKSYSEKENKQVITGEYTLSDNGDIKAEANIKSTGIQYDDNYGITDMDSKEKDIYYKAFFKNINNLKINSISAQSDNLNTLFNENISFSATNYGIKSGNRMLVRLNAFNVNDNIPKRIRNRKLPLEIQYGFLDVDEVIINLPKEYKIEALSKNMLHESKFGTYKVTIEKINENQLKYTRELIVNQDLYSIEDYESYRKFIKKVNQLDNSKIVLIKNQNL